MVYSSTNLYNRLTISQDTISNKNESVDTLEKTIESNRVRPVSTSGFFDSIQLFHREIEKCYGHLPWPSNLRKICVCTQVQGGRGDISAAAKVIALMQRSHPSLHFDWVIQGSNSEKIMASEFIDIFEDRSKVVISEFKEFPENSQIDLLILGPFDGSSKRILQSKIQRNIPVFFFMENAAAVNGRIVGDRIAYEVRHLMNADSLHYPNLHSILFPYSYNNVPIISMGLQKGSGVFLDRFRINAFLSQGYFGPEYLYSIQEEKLKNQILYSFNGNFNNDEVSFNFGYAHNCSSWMNFIDCIAMQEKNKNVVVVLNQEGASTRGFVSAKDFAEKIFTELRIDFLRNEGYENIIIKSEDTEDIIVNSGVHLEKKFTVILRQKFAYIDVKYMQLAAERILATGDNSAAEAWSAKCKLYLYDVYSLGYKDIFLNQQVKVANECSENVGKILELFYSYVQQDSVKTKEEFDRKNLLFRRLLNAPSLQDETLAFCDKIVKEYDFEKILENSLKRCVWIHTNPHLKQIEIEKIDQDVKDQILLSFQNKSYENLSFSSEQFTGIQKHIQDDAISNGLILFLKRIFNWIL
ncbi:MAG: DUF562 domain-containing protein [Chlamydiae bacterium]|nr:DUF562 domain-containing protein [Chlamydiota bacterium]